MNVKKRIICNILCFMIVLCSMFTFTACDKDCKHKWGEWETVVESTCTTTGTKKRQCSKCEEFEEDSIAVIAHNFGSWVEEVLANCTVAGTKAHKDCSVCKKHFDNDGNEILDLTITIDENAHNYGVWTSNGDGTHSRQCLHNSEHVETVSCAGGEATCEEKAVCDTCKGEYGELKNHTFGAWNEEVPATCSKTGTKGYKDCSVCEKHFDKDGNKIVDLTLAINSEAHNYGAWTSNGDGTHTRVCSYNNAHLEKENCAGGKATCEEKAVCDICKKEYGNFGGHTFGEWINEKPATCSEVGTKGHKDCLVCEKHFDKDGNEIEDLTIAVNSEAHNYGAWTSNGDGTHTRVCSYNNAHLENGDCTGGEATCDKKAVCDTCKGEYGELKNHTFGDWNEEVPATCSKTGTKGYKDCSVCEKHFDNDGNEITDLTLELNAVAHNYGAWTSNGNGYHTRVCLYDNKHTELDVCSGGEATCEERAVCEICEEAYGNLADHTFGDWNEEVPATCSQAGTKAHKDCLVCEKHFDENDNEIEDLAIEIDEEAHNYGAWTSNGDNTHSRVCAYNGEHIETLDCTGGEATCEERAVCEICEEAYGNLAEHTFGDWNEEVPATCSQTGTKAHKDCLVCEKHFDENDNEIEDLTIEIDEEAHNYGTWTSNGDNTHSRVCAYNGEHIETLDCTGGEATCEERAVCETCEEAYGNLAEHTFGDWNEEVPANCQNTGTKAHKDCLVCEKHFDENDNEILDLTIEIDEDAHDMATEVVEPKCSEQGYTIYYCKVKGCDFRYNDNYVGANGHTWEGESTCLEGCGCLYCDETQPELGHNHELIETFEATCETGAYEYYKCSRCDDNYTISLGDAKGHNITGVTPSEVHIDGCKYQYVYKCSANNCGADVEGDIFYKHTFKATITTENEATCMKDGVKILTCESCGHTEEEIIEKNENGHIWDEGILDEVTSIRTFHCINEDEEGHTCTASYTAIDASNTNSAGVDSSNLALAGGSVKLENAQLEFDNTALGSLENKDLIISSEILQGEDLSNALSKLTEDEREQLAMVAGENPVIYNFTVADNSEPDKLIETFNDGYVTVRLPYTPVDEDVDSIAVWYISGGKPVAIEAEYSNGYITFKTKHFSEYTVTRLLPEERCALYGCVEKETVFEGTCLQDGYILKLCIRCHKSEKIITKVAEGHHYSEIETPATCTEDGKIVFDCDNCDYYYTQLLPKLGHKYEETENHEATCVEAGRIVYSCQNNDCDEKRIITIPQLPHEISETNIPATCETDGYRLSKCANCSYEIKVITSKAKGHNYISKFVWADDYSSATIVFTCLNDKEHVIEENAEITIVVTPATCTSNEITTYTATVVFEGVEYTNVKETLGEKLDHTYLDKWLFNDNMHWKECSCGDKDNMNSHTFDDGIVVIEPTCKENGEIKYTCECGYEKFEDLAPTYEHTYVDGVCTGCGKTEDSCDHNEFTNVEVNMSDYGACDGVFTYKVCSCGEVCLVEEEAFYNLKCNMNDMNTDYGVDDNGNMYMIASGKCPDCGLYVEMKSYPEQNGCETFVKSYYTLKMADVIILNNAYCEAIYESHGITSNKTLYFEEFSDCGSSIEVYMCGDCGKITEVISMDGVKCDVEYDQDSGTYEDGRMYEIYTMTCKDCGLVFVDKRVTKQINACEYEYYREMTISKGITLIYSCIMEDSVSEHEYEVTYEKLGETCEDGVKITKKCSICGDEFSRELKGHEETSEHYIYFKNYGCCGGELVVDKCNVCGKIVHVRGDSPQCELYETERRTYLDDNNIEHTVIVYNCKLCGLQREEDSYIFEIDGCYITNSVNVNYTLDGEVIFEYSDLMPDDNHNLLEEYIDDDNNCENGYTIKISCSNCDYSYNILGFGHKYEKEEITSEDKDCCHFSIIYEMCAVCHKEQYNEGFEMNFECKFIEKEESYEDEFGNMHYTLTSTCEKCGLVMITEHYSNQVSSCRIDFYSSLVIIFNGEELFNKEFVFVEENHNYKTTYFVEDGMTCEDGYTIIMICEDCGDQIREPGWGHAHQMVEEFFTKDGTCGITICISKCAICGEINNVNIENIRLECMPENQSDFEAKEVVDDNGVTHSVIEFTCVNCGRTYYVDTWVNPLYDCCYEYNQLIRITDNDEVVFENTTSYEREQHDLEIEYKFYGEESDCNLGYDVFEKCKHCDYENNYSNFGHKEICTEINLSDYGLCGGIIYKVECEVCEKILSQNINEYGCCWINIESIENKDIYMCEFCKTYKSEERIVGEKDNNCSYIITHKTTYYLEDGTVLLVIESYETRYEHNYNYRVELNGSSCTDGGIVYYHCENCGHEYEREIYNHETIMETKYSLNDYENICGGDVTVYRCACGDLGKVDSEKLLCNFCHYDSYGNSDENGIWHEYSMYMCNNCGLMRIDDYFNIENGCTTYRYNNVKFVLMSEDGNEQILFEIELVEDIYYNHNYKATDVELFGETCHDGYIVYQTCVHCGESVEYESWNHENFEFVLVDLKEIGACGGYVLKYACPCELTNDINLNLNCNYNENAYEKVIDDVKYNISEITCEHCGLYIEIISYTTVNGCTAFDTKTINVVVNDVSVYSTTVQSSEYAYHDIEYTYILNGETCDDGYQIIETCKNCDYYETREGSGHETHKRISYNLSDYGCCGGTIDISSCICEEHKEINYNPTCELQIEYEETIINGEIYQIPVLICSKCNLKIKSLDYEKQEGCKVYRYNEYIISVNNTYIIESFITKYYIYDRHNDVLTHELLGETCEDGVKVIYTCRDCGQSREDIYNYHYMFTEDYYDLSEHSSCGYGYLSIDKCACGFENNINWSFNYSNYVENPYVDENGNYHKVQSYTCDDCGLRYEDDSYIVFDKENCSEITYHNIYLVVGGLIVNEQYSYSREKHTLETTYQFETSEQNCEKGVTLTQICKYCDYNHTETHYHHYQFESEIINLDEFGSVCGGYVVYNSCACGQSGSMDLGYAICDLDEKPTEMWFDNYVKNEYYRRPYGASIYTCAVTDPEKCSLKIRYAHYYVRYDDLCYDIEYHRWQFGYNDLDGTYMYEIIYEVNRDEEHKYVDRTFTTDLDNGHYVVTEEYRCKNCGVGHIYKDYYDNNDLLYKEEKFYYSFNNETKGLNVSYQLYEYMYRENSKGEMVRYPTRVYSDYTVNGIKTNYTETTYTYDFNYVAPFGTDSYKVYESHKDNGNLSYEVEKHKTYFEYEYRHRFNAYDWYDYDNMNWFMLYEYYRYDIGLDYENWRKIERTFTFNLSTNYGVDAHEVIRVESDSDGRYSSVTFAEFYYTKENDTDEDTNWYTLHLYRTERYNNENEYYENSDYTYDFDYYAPFGKNAYLETIDYNDSNGNDYKESIATSKVNSIIHGYHYYTYEFYRYKIEFEGTENEYWSKYEYTYSFDSGCIQTTNYSDSYGLVTTNTIDYHKELINADSHIKEPTCTQFGIGSMICEICKFHQEEYDIYPICHNWIYDYQDNKYHCLDCELVNVNGASGVVVMEDFTEKYGNGTHFVVGYFNRENVQFTYYISLVNPYSDEEIVLDNLQFVTYEDLGIVAMGVSKEDVRAMAELMGYNVDDYLVKLVFVPIGADLTLDYAITFDNEKLSKTIYIDENNNLIIDELVIGYVNENGEVVDNTGNVVAIVDYQTGKVYDGEDNILGILGEYIENPDLPTEPENDVYINENGQLIVNGVESYYNEVGEIYNYAGEIIGNINIETGDVYDIDGIYLGTIQIKENIETPEYPVVPEQSVYINENGQLVIEGIVADYFNEMGEIYDFDGNIIGIIDIETGDVYNNNGDYLGCVEIGGGEDPEEGLYIDEMGQVFVNGVLVTDITEAGEMFDVDGNLIAVIDVETGDVYDINGKILGRLEIEENPDEPVMPDEPINPEEPVVPETNIYIDEMNQVVIDDLVFGVVNESGEIFCDGILVGIIIFETGDVYDISDNCLGNIYGKTNSNDNMNAA